MIVTVTPNPSLDRTLEIPALDRGAVIRAASSHVEAGGKGINVVRALLANGHRGRAVVPVGGPEGTHFELLLADGGLTTDLVRIGGPVRTNVTLVEPDGTVTKINASGPALAGDELDRLVAAATEAAAGAAWVAVCGSLPPGAPADLHARLVAAGHAAGAKVAVDTSGRPLAAAVEAAPELCKPNRDELTALAGRRLPTLGAVVDAADELRGRGVGAVLVSLGRHGAVLVDADGATHADTPPLVPRSDVGAGDATLAGFLAAGGAGTGALRTAVAFGAAAVRLPGTAMPGPDDLAVDEVRLAPVERDRHLDD